MDNPEPLTNKRERIRKWQSNMDNPEPLTNKRERIRKWQSNMDNPETLAVKGTQDKDKRSKNITQYVLYTTILKQTQIT